VAPTIRIDADVYAWLQSKAHPFEDSPNSVLRHLAGLDDATRNPSPDTTTRGFGRSADSSRETHSVDTRLTGRLLNARWRVGAEHALYHHEGTFYENLQAFPGALFDRTGYVLFPTRDSYRNCRELSIGRKTNVPGGIAQMSSYVRAESLK
jgi:5-methylcytosine-specific restriction protein A